MSKEIPVDDAELEALMAELEAQNAEIIAEQEKTKAPEPLPVPAASASEVLGSDLHETMAPTPVEEPVKVSAPVEPEADNPYGPDMREAVVPLPVEPIPIVMPPAAEATPKTKDESGFAESSASVAAKSSGLDFYLDADQFRRDTAVSDTNLDKCMMEQSGLRAYYGTMAARAEAQAGRMKARFEVLEATLYDHHRKELAASGEKTTEKMVENAVRTDPRWLKGKNMLIEAESIAAINKALVQSLADRRDMVIQLGADRRDEFKGAARVIAEQNERDDLRNRALNAGQRRAA